ncbi:MAG: deoxyhypusine synthase family protein [Nitrosarchaeum sp.]|nr:deoxyhypusine synthase family protein [Nitrosarchaeum sp.]
MTQDVVRVTDLALACEKGGIVALGGSVPKHHICNAFLFREGAEFAVYVTTAGEFEGSNAGASISEAQTWGKIRCDAQAVKVVGDASIIFPLIVGSGAFDEVRKNEGKK